MSFAEPTRLLALLALPLLASAWAVTRHRRRRFAIRHPGVATIRSIALPRRALWRRVLPVALLTGCTVALAAAFAKPQRTVSVPVDRASVVLVTDESGSMQADDVAPTRLQAVQGAARSFLASAPSRLLVGFAGFATTVESNVTPTTDRQAVRAAIDALQARGGTATGDALSTALDQLEARRRQAGNDVPAAIVLLSDGTRTVGSDPLEAAARAKELGIAINTVALGTDSGVVWIDGQEIRVPPDPETLRQIAAESGGRAYAVDDADTLDAVYRELGSRIGTRKVKREVTVAFVAGGFVLLLGGLGAGLQRRGRLV